VAESPGGGQQHLLVHRPGEVQHALRFAPPPVEQALVVVMMQVIMILVAVMVASVPVLVKGCINRRRRRAAFGESIMMMAFRIG
jgi:hypothetical protein